MYISQNTAERIKLIAKSKNVAIKDMLIACDLSKNAISSMLSRGSWIQANNLAKMADYLDCSVDYLLGRSDNPNGFVDNEELSDKENRLVAAYRNKPEMQRSVDILLGLSDGEFNKKSIDEPGKTVVAKIAAFGGGVSTKVYKEGEIDEEKIRKLAKEREVKDDF